MNFGEGEVLSIASIHFPCGDSHQNVTHLLLIWALCFCFIAAVLLGSARLSVGGNSLVSDVSPSAAFLASMSASLLPGILTWPAV
jgi:hypothetical protein